MARAARSVHVEATVEQVWDYLRDPKSIVEWWPNCTEIHNVQACADGGCTFKWTNKPGGVTCCGEIAEFVSDPDDGIVLHLAGDICGELHWRARRENGGTQVTFDSDYDLPVRALIPYLSPVRLLTFQQQEADEIAAKVREHFRQA